MSIAKGAVNVLLLIGKLVSPPLPITASHSNKTIHLTSMPFKTSQKAKRLWSLFLCNLCFLTILSLWKLVVLNSRWKDIPNNMEQMGVLLIIMAAPIIDLSLLGSLQVYSDEITFVVNELCKLQNVYSNNNINKNNSFKFGNHRVTVKIEKNFVYIMSIIFVAVPLVFPCLPLIFDYEPVRFTIFSILSSVFSGSDLVTFNQTVATLIAFDYWFVAAMHAGTAVLCFVLIGFCIADCTLQATCELKQMPKHSRSLVVTKTFQKRFILYRKLEILTSVTRQASKDASAVTVLMGGLLIASNAYLAIYMYDKMPLVMYIFSCCTVIVIFAMIIILTTLAGKPNANSIEFQDNWKRYLFSKQTRLQLASCGPIGFSIGFMGGIVKASTSLTIADSFLNSIVNLVLFQ